MVLPGSKVCSRVATATLLWVLNFSAVVTLCGTMALVSFAGGAYSKAIGPTLATLHIANSASYVASSIEITATPPVANFTSSTNSAVGTSIKVISHAATVISAISIIAVPSTTIPTVIGHKPSYLVHLCFYSLL